MQLSSLNDSQRKAVQTTDGPLMILAGAGSGKTRTLVAKIIYLLDEKKIGPYRILAVTFSNKAAREMRERVAKSVNLDIKALQITTFHSFCAHLLRNEAQYLGLGKNFTIYDASESKALVKSILAKRGISQKEISPYEVLDFIEAIKNEGIYLSKGEKYFEDYDQFMMDIYKEYEEEMLRSNALDFGGLICGAIELFERFPEVAENYKKRYQYLLVDEYQDTNRAQFLMLKLICNHERNICVVGDEDQSIYSWRGADIRNILDFEQVYGDANIIKLEQNYRSSKNIIEAASVVIEQNSLRKGKTMWTDNPEGDSIVVMECVNEKKEAEFVVSTLKEINHTDKEVNYDDFAIFYRNNSQSRSLEDVLRLNNIPYRVVGGIKFYERKEVKDLLSYLRLVINPQDNLAVSRIVNVPARGLGAVTLRKLENEASQLNISLWEMFKELTNNRQNYPHIRVTQKVMTGLSLFVELIETAVLLNDARELPSIIYEKILYESGYWDSLKGQRQIEAQARMENLEELGNALKAFEKSRPNPTLINFLESITLDTSKDEENLKAGEVSLMTIHGAKGLEFPYVFVTGVEENLFPSIKSMESGQNGLEEERRLFYVAMTRAMKRLYLSFAQGRMLFGQLRFNGPGRFLYEIPESYINWQRYETEDYGDDSWSRSPTQSSFSDDDFSQVNPHDDDGPVYRVDSVKQVKFPSGSVIVHDLYGEGFVLEATGSGDQEKVTIQFKDGSKKRFMVKFAPLSFA